MCVNNLCHDNIPYKVITAVLLCACPFVRAFTLALIILLYISAVQWLMNYFIAPAYATAIIMVSKLRSSWKILSYFTMWFVYTFSCGFYILTLYYNIII